MARMVAVTAGGSQVPDGRGSGLLATPGRRRLLFALLYFSEGAPVGFLWWALPVMLARAGWDVGATTALTSSLAIPWALKFLWAPLLDALRGRRFGPRAWIASSQVVMLASLLPLLWIPLERAGAVLGWLLLVHACAAASQDVGIDALAIESTPARERGRLNGWMQVGYLLARALFGGAALGLRALAGDVAIVAALIAALSLTLGLHLAYRTPEPPAPAREASRQRSAARARFRAALATAALSRGLWVGLALAVTVGAAFETAGGLANLRLVDAGFSDEAIAGIFRSLVPVGLAGGALLGGFLSDRSGPRRAVAVSAAGVVLAVVAFARVQPVADAPGPTRACLGAVYLTAGLLTASSYALFMDLAHPDLAATQFSAYMAATNLCELGSIRFGGRVAAESGYPAAMLLAAGVTAAAALLLVLLPSDRNRVP